MRLTIAAAILARLLAMPCSGSAEARQRGVDSGVIGGISLDDGTFIGFCALHREPRLRS
jgi:hypothetical protein